MKRTPFHGLMLATPVLLLGAAGLAQLLVSGRLAPATAGPRVAMHADQAARSAEAIVPLLGLGPAELSRPRLDYQLGAHGAQVPFWEVAAALPGRAACARMTWRADTGELVGVADWRPARRPVPAPGSELNAREAVEAAWSWMQRLGLARRAVRWQVAQTAPPNGRAAYPCRCFCWRAGDRWILTTINIRDGGLRSLCTSGLFTCPLGMHAAAPQPTAGGPTPHGSAGAAVGPPDAGRRP